MRRGESRRRHRGQSSILELVSTLSHDLTIGQDDERTAIREADMPPPPPPLEIERASEASRAGRSVGRSVAGAARNYSSRPALFICRLIRPDKTVGDRRPPPSVGRTIGPAVAATLHCLLSAVLRSLTADWPGLLHPLKV